MLGHMATLNRKSKVAVVLFCFRRFVIDTSGKNAEKTRDSRADSNKITKVFFKLCIVWQSVKKVNFAACT